MEKCVEIVKSVCCTCLSRNRCLYKLCRVPEGLNNLYLLLSYDPEAFNEVFFRGVSDLLVCWECRAILCNITEFRKQSVEAQKLLTTVLYRKQLNSSQRCLSNLGKQHKTKYDSIIVFEDNFVDCGSIDSSYTSENSIGTPWSSKSLERTPVIDSLRDIDDGISMVDCLKDVDDENVFDSLKDVNDKSAECDILKVPIPISDCLKVGTPISDSRKVGTTISDSLKEVNDKSPESDIVKVRTTIDSLKVGTPISVSLKVGTPISDSRKEVVGGASKSDNLENVEDGAPISESLKDIDDDRLKDTDDQAPPASDCRKDADDRPLSDSLKVQTPIRDNLKEVGKSTSLKDVDCETPIFVEATPTSQNKLEKTPTNQISLERTPTNEIRLESVGVPTSQNILEKTPKSQNWVQKTPTKQQSLERTPTIQDRIVNTPTSKNRHECTPLKSVDYGTPKSQIRVDRTPISDSQKDVYPTPVDQKSVEMKYYDPSFIEVVILEEKREASESPKKERHSIDTEFIVKSPEPETNLIDDESKKYEEVSQNTKNKFYVILDEKNKDEQDGIIDNTVKNIAGCDNENDVSTGDLDPPSASDSNSLCSKDNLQKNKRKNKTPQRLKEIEHHVKKNKIIEKEIDYSIEEEKDNEKANTKTEKVPKNTDQAKETEPYGEVFKIYFGQELMNEEQMKESRVERKMAATFNEATFKCESCLEVFKSRIEMLDHVRFHFQKNNHTKCEICHIYVYNKLIQSHTDFHYMKYVCNLCDHVSYQDLDMVQHLREEHEIEDSHSERQEKPSKEENWISKIGDKPKKVYEKKEKVADRSVRNKKITHHMSDDPDKKYQCGECMECFHSNKQRWRHTQRFHREGFECDTCGKRFSFKPVLENHIRRHGGRPPLPRQRCPVCLKMVRCDLFKSHALTHTDRPTFTCAECEKVFVSRASYEHHLKYTKAHAVEDVRKFKCDQCEKRFKSRAELRDHVNYRHMGRTQHKCFVCGKALATVRGVTRHVFRAHSGIKERPLDQVCQQCGKTFRDKKSLREHESIHTGERPLTCELCGCTFRQSSSLYTHKKRLHQVYPTKVQVTLVDSDDVEMASSNKR